MSDLLGSRYILYSQISTVFRPKGPFQQPLAITLIECLIIGFVIEWLMRRFGALDQNLSTSPAHPQLHKK